MRDRNQVYLQVFGNILVWANWPILDPKMTHPHKSGSIVKKIKNWYSEIGQWVDHNNINDFSQKMLFGTNGSFWTQKWPILIREHRQKTLVTLSGFWPLKG